MSIELFSVYDAKGAAPKRAKRVNSRKRFREEEGYDEAEVGLRYISPPEAPSSKVLFDCQTLLQACLLFCIPQIANLSSPVHALLVSTGAQQPQQL